MSAHTEAMFRGFPPFPKHPATMPRVIRSEFVKPGTCYTINRDQFEDELPRFLVAASAVTVEDAMALTARIVALEDAERANRIAHRELHAALNKIAGERTPWPPVA